MATKAESKNSDDPREFFGAFVCDDATHAALGEVVKDHGWSEDRIQSGGIANAVRSLTVMRSPEFLIVDLSESSDPRGDINALAEVCEPGTVVLAIGTTNDVTLYRDLIASGVQDYLVKPVTSEVLRESVEAAQAALAEPVVEQELTPEDSTLVAVIGVRGGSGASTIATSVAWLAAEEWKRNVGLLDLDIHFGTHALTFDLEPGRGLVDAIENPGRVDGLFIERATTKPRDNLSLLGSEAPLSDPMTPDPTALQHLQDALKGAYDFMVVEVPRNIAISYPLLLAEAKHVVLVTDLSLAATRDAIRILSFLKQTVPAATVHLVANKVQPSNLREVSEKDFAASVEHEVDLSIPLDTKSFVQAAKKGKTLPQAMPQAKPTNAMRTLVERLAGEKPGKSKSKLFSKLFAKDK